MGRRDSSNQEKQSGDKSKKRERHSKSKVDFEETLVYEDNESTAGCSNFNGDVEELESTSAEGQGSHASERRKKSKSSSSVKAESLSPADDLEKNLTLSESPKVGKKEKGKKARKHSCEADFDAAVSPSKKTKQDASESTEPIKKKKKSKRKKKIRPPPAATNNTKDQCLQYLKDWQSPCWKFCKNKQSWLLMHAFDKDMVPHSDFEILLRYLEGLKGAARERLLMSAGELLKNVEVPKQQDTEDVEDHDVDTEKYERARLIVQMLD